MHSVSFGCWTPKLRVIVYDNFNQDVYKKWLCFIKRYDLKAKRARNVKVISMGWTKQDGIRMYRRLKLLLFHILQATDYPENDGMRFRNDKKPLHENWMQIHAWHDDTVIYSKTYYSICGSFIVD
ncbi:hypothetical protein BUJ35_022525 [Salmonella enterica subsp. enterica serovar Muenchen]|nr:hypothetical protein BUJ35_022525 [Salmonella enterica subsp. enterica serovar Muenchen]